MKQLIYKIIVKLLKVSHLEYLISDEAYLKILFRRIMNQQLDLKNPKTFNAKLQYLKLHDRKPLYTKLVDKFEVKKYVADLIGEEYIIPTLGVWEKFDDIDFAKLPEKFVLKCTHDSGSTAICDKNDLMTINKAKKKIGKCLKRNYYWPGREWPYRDVQPRIIAEPFLIDSETKELRDYKFTCFDGAVNDVMVCMDRNTNDVKFYFFDYNWNLLRLNYRGINAPKDFTVKPPQNYKKMFEIAGKLSIGIPYVRVDLYNVDGHIYFGELTLYPSSGMDKNLLPATDMYFGSKIKM
jgi:hypothetical protein